jgi:hypothetical protein
MAKNISIADVDQAEAELVAAKKNKKLSADELTAIEEKVVEVRSAFRQQEVAAGRRTGLVGGDAEGR